MDSLPASSSKRLYGRTFVIAVVSQSIFVMGNTLMTHHARWVKALGGSETDVGQVLGFGAVIGMLVRPWMAQWINRIGARNMWGIGYLVFGVGALCNILLDELNWTVYAIRSIFVFGSSIVFASSLTYVTQISPRERRTEAIGIVGAGGFIGMLVGPALGDMLIGSPNPNAEDF
ncbi:MAG: MFS transporter, partial [Planctomycetaceae bacterium]|nr:MFS transporter [Planctomycetaceae bacterium]